MKILPGHQRKRPTNGDISVLLVRVAPDVKAAADRLAAAEGISLAALVRRILGEFVQRESSRRTVRKGGR